MEQVQLDQRARKVIATAEEGVTSPDHEQFFNEYHVHVGGEYFLELRSHTRNTGTDLLGQSTRYVYLKGPHKQGNCRPTISVDINELVETGKVKGLVQDYSGVQDALSVATPGVEKEVELLTLLFDMLKAHDTGMGPDSAEVEAIHELFLGLLAGGSLVSFKELYLKGNDGARLGVQSCTIEGSLQHVKQPWPHRPRTKVAVQLLASKTQTVVSENEHGNLESWVETADALERAAEYASPDDVTRDDSGRIIMISGSHFDERAVANAERAMGARALDLGRVALVESYVDTLIAPLTNGGESSPLDG